jgi:hypothetical protein
MQLMQEPRRVVNPAQIPKNHREDGRAFGGGKYVACRTQQMRQNAFHNIISFSSIQNQLFLRLYSYFSCLVNPFFHNH